MPVLRSKQLKSRKMRTPSHSKGAAITPQYPTAMPKSTRQTATHIFFWGGPLSNWHGGSNYSGKRTFELVLPNLTELDISHPPSEAFSSRLLLSADFRGGEQWMMAMKGWLFERDIELSEKLFPDGGDAEQEFELLRSEMLAPTGPSLNEKEKRAMYDSCLCKCLRSKSPMEQKNYGRHCRNFNVKVWDVASVPIVVACQIARAEVDDQLRRLYLRSENRVFVE